MPRRSLRQRLTACIATFAILVAALAPGVSQAMSAFGEGGARWLEVCTSAGMLWIAVDEDGEQPSGGDSGVMSGHCPYCATHAGSFALPPTAAAVFAVDGPHRLLPGLFDAAPRPLFAWAAAHPRAPPRAS